MIRSIYINVLISVIVELNGDEGEALFSCSGRVFFYFGDWNSFPYIGPKSHFSV